MCPAADDVGLFRKRNRRMAVNAYPHIRAGKLVNIAVWTSIFIKRDGSELVIRLWPWRATEMRRKASSGGGKGANQPRKAMDSRDTIPISGAETAGLRRIVEGN
jgi:hypothetical protein